MKIVYRGQFTMAGRDLIRRCGYGEHYDRQAGKTSYSKHLGGAARYPRFHAYVTEYEQGFEIDLHLDQKAPVYAGASHAHNADYDGSAVVNEVERIKTIIDRHLKPKS